MLWWDPDPRRASIRARDFTIVVRGFLVCGPLLVREQIQNSACASRSGSSMRSQRQGEIRCGGLQVFPVVGHRSSQLVELAPVGNDSSAADTTPAASAGRSSAYSETPVSWSIPGRRNRRRPRRRSAFELRGDRPRTVGPASSWNSSRDRGTGMPRRTRDRRIARV